MIVKITSKRAMKVIEGATHIGLYSGATGYRRKNVKLADLLEAAKINLMELRDNGDGTYYLGTTPYSEGDNYWFTFRSKAERDYSVIPATEMGTYLLAQKNID